MISLNIFSNFNINNCVIFKMAVLTKTLKCSNFLWNYENSFHLVTISLFFLRVCLMVLEI